MEEHKPFTWLGGLPYPEHVLTAGLVEIGRASCRERVSIDV